MHQDQRIHWDFTTLALKRCLLSRVERGYDVLEIGTGPYAILAILVAKRLGCNVLACDVNEAHVANAKKTVVLNGVRVEVVRSDLFDNISGKFDTVFFNSVYIPKAVGERLGIDQLHHSESDWCGGELGIEVIDRFLGDAPNHLKERGEILLGFNPKYLREELAIRSCNKYRYQLEKRQISAMNPSLVLILRRS